MKMIPKEESQMDFGEFGYIEIDGERRKLYGFSMILRYFRMRFTKFIIGISTRNVIRMHINAFGFFGGYTGTILYGIMK